MSEQENIDIVYDIVESKAVPERHILSVMVDNEFGVLARVIGLFSARGYNIESLTVAEVEHKEKLSRITIVTTATDAVIEQIHKQLERIVPVHGVHDLTVEGAYVERELGLFKVVCSDEARIEALRIADMYRAKAVDTTGETLIFELTGTLDRLDAFIEVLRPLGLVEICRTGVAALSRGQA